MPKGGRIRALTRGSQESLRLFDFSDKEIAAIVADVRDASGWASRQMIATRIFPYATRSDTDRSRHAMRCVAIRLGWLRRYGVLEKMDKKSQKQEGYDLDDSYWALTEAGEAFLRGSLTKEQRRVLEGLSDERLIAATSVLTDRYVDSSSVGANLMRREWLYGVNRRNGTH